MTAAESDQPKIVFCTGHRPDYVGGYSDQALEYLVETAKAALMELQPDKVIVGGAVGWDTACALACIDLNIPYILAVPFEGQESRWPEKSQKVYNHTKDCAAEVVMVCEPGYAPWKMMKRNQWMTDNGEIGLALFHEEKTHGGTFQCVKYALETNKPMMNAWNIFANGSKLLSKIDPNILSKSVAP